MTNCLFFTFGFVLFLTFSFGGMTQSSIHRSFLNMHRSILEISVVTIGDDGEDVKPYFNEPQLEKYVIDYLKDNVGKYTTDYKASIIYFDVSTNAVNTNHHADGVRISLTSKINMFYTYKHSREFRINSRGEINE